MKHIKFALLFIALALSANAAVIQSPLSYLTGTLVGPGGLSNALATATNGSHLILTGAGETVRGRGRSDSAVGHTSDLNLEGKTNVVIEALGTYLLYSTNYGNTMSVTKCSNIVIRGLTFDTSITNHYPSTLAESNTAALYLGTNVGIYISRCSIIKAPRQGISALTYGTTRVTIDNCSFQSVGSSNVFGGTEDGAGISGITDNWTIQDCSFYTGYNYGIELESHSPLTVSQKNVVIRNCVFYDMRNFAIKQFTATDMTPDGISIIGCSFSGPGSAAAWVSMGGAKNVLISDNSFGSGARTGIGISPISSPQSKSALENSIIANNVFNTSLIGIYSYIYQGTVGNNNLTISGNTFLSNSFYGAAIHGTNILITDNNFVSCGYAGDYLGCGIWLSPYEAGLASSAASSKVRILNNTFSGTSSTNAVLAYTNVSQIQLDGNVWGTHLTNVFIPWPRTVSYDGGVSIRNWTNINAGSNMLIHVGANLGNGHQITWNTGCNCWTNQ